MEEIDSIAPNDSRYCVEKMASASDSRSNGDDAGAKAEASAMSVNALSAATTRWGAFVKGEMLAKSAGSALAAWRGARKAGPPVLLC